MFATSVGRRLVIIVIAVSFAIITLVLAIAVNTSISVLRQVTQASVQQRHDLLLNALNRQVAQLQSQTNELTEITRSRTRWSAGEIRAYVIELIGSSGTNNAIVNVNFYWREGQSQLYTFDYVAPPDMPPGIIMPINRTITVENLPPDSWVLALLDQTEGRWIGPTAPLFGDYSQTVMAYAVPFRNDSTAPDAPADGVIWVDVPLSIFTTTIQDLVALEQEMISATGEYSLLLAPNGNTDYVITSLGAPAERVIPGQEPFLLQPLPPSGEPTRMLDPVRSDAEGQSLVLVDTLPNTQWRFVSVISDQVISSVLPFGAVAQLVLVAIIGLVTLAIAVQQFITRTVTEPLSRLSLASQEIGSGDLRYQIEYLDRRDEIGRLARALDDMKENLSRSYRELENWSGTLEQRVKSRTRELDIARRDAQASAGELRAVYDESLLVVSAYQLQTILQTLVQRIQTLLEASYAGVWLVSEDRLTQRLVASTNPDKSHIGVTVAIDRGLVGQAISRQELLVVDDYPNWSGKIDINQSENMHQAMAVPLIFSGEPIGGVIVGRTYDAPFFEVNDQRLLRLFANLVSPAVRNAQLFVQRDEAMLEANRANQVKTRFLASVTHELRTPLNLVINNMDFMKIGAFGDVTPEQIERLDQTIRSAEHLLYLINDLLDVSKIEAGEMELFLQENSLYAILQDVIDNTEVLLEQYNKVGRVQFIQEIDQDIPPFPMDARRIRQVFVNLLSNALKFTQEGSVTLRIQNRRHYIRADVIDTGMGIPDEEKHKLFEAFERTSRAKEEAIEGTGLGLPICKFLVEAHGGELTVESVVGQGTTFSFSLPLKQKKGEVSETQQMTTLLNRVRGDVAVEGE
ncbi:MAG: ATP-binding protein [Phototrophicaceae bacterium]|jgi:signal transduction histidine kinase/HAMP domain-containing protein